MKSTRLFHCQENATPLQKKTYTSFFQVTLWSPKWRSPTTLEKVTNNNSQKGHSEKPEHTTETQRQWFFVGFFRGEYSRGGGNWGTLRIPREDWGTLGKIRGITTPPLRILVILYGIAKKVRKISTSTEVTLTLFKATASIFSAPKKIKRPETKFQSSWVVKMRIFIILVYEINPCI